MPSRSFISRTKSSRTSKTRPVGAVANPLDIHGCVYYADIQDPNTFIYSSSNVVEQIINKISVGTTFTENITNGTFPSNVTGWSTFGSTVVWDATNGGSLKCTNTSASNGFALQNLTLIAGKQYRIKASSVGSGTSTQSIVQIRDNASAVNIVTNTVSSNNATFDFIFVATSSNITIRLENDATSGHFLYWDNVSVIQLDSSIQQNPSNQATLVSNAINGQQALLFNGTNNYYANSQKAVSKSFTKVVTIKFDFTSTNSGNVLSSQTNSDHSLVVFQFNLTDCRISCEQGNNQFDLTGLDAQNVLTIVERFNTNGTKDIWVNGVKCATSTTIKNITDPTFYIGSVQGLGATSFYKGYIGDLIVYDRYLQDHEVGLLDEHQRRKWRVPQDAVSYLAVSGIGQSNCVGEAQSQSDPISSGKGLNFIPTYHHFRDTNDKTGDSYSQSSVGSFWPPFVNKLNTLSSKKIVHISCAKMATSISTQSSSNPSDRTLDWGGGSTLRSNFVTNTLNMLNYFGKTKLDWIVLNQGERDVSYMPTDPTWTKALYKSAYLDLLNFCKANFPGVKILCVQTVQGRSTDGLDTPQNTAQWNLVIQAQQELAASESNVWLIQDTSTFTITNGNIESVDGIHYTKAGNLTIGQSVATTINSNL
jgi:hypothetical protein